MPPEATILHADLDAFYASVEQRDAEELRGRPVIVGAGVVMAASYEAKARGVRTAMGLTKARRLCPAAVVVPPRFASYVEASRRVFEIFDDTTPLVEALSIDEAFLDVRGFRRLAGTPTEMATRLRERVRDEIGLPITVGIARTKFLAKVASGVAKPDGLLLVPPERELAFLHALPVERVWGVGKVTSQKLRTLGLNTVGDLADFEEAMLTSILGQAAGRQLHALAHNRDPRPVRARRRRRSIGAQRAVGLRRMSADEIEPTLVALIDRVTRRLRAAHRLSRTVTLRLRFGDYARATRSQTLPFATAHTHVVLGAATALLDAAMPAIRARGLTLVGISLSNLEDDDATQLVLSSDERRAALDTALDAVRDRFGATAVTRGVLVGRPHDLEYPLLPD